ncbi:uncharacterized protein I206_105113 [Kwoniella pini CBS 10737]|uniref:Peptidase S1 domain-containing protein n=1 Tax=Kwoniella pini CBS 10737 TaxID=1296096 RepID=A0A1B9I8M9_9TREE|nr:uncharacterized protein I206_02654 [Kwoniella pini CBS 10737]OCF51938.1 hypothetical protein I206_02654 [Kwoniella pini CBS 10737]
MPLGSSRCLRQSPLNVFSLQGSGRLGLYAHTYATTTELPLLQPNRRTTPPGIGHLEDPISNGSHRLKTSSALQNVLPYESYPKISRRSDNSECVSDRLGDGIVLVIHAVSNQRGDVDFEISSGFIIEPNKLQEEQILVTCSHTLDALSTRYANSDIHSFILPSSSELSPIPITSFPSGSISDLLICTIPKTPILRSLPVSPFPIYKGQKVLVHQYGSGQAWIGEVRREWKEAEMMGYRNYSWREVQPGTSSALPYITFSTLPSNGSSGGPIVDAQSGAVIGVVSGSRTISAVKGERGYGASAENIFELFSLPGFIPSSQKYK